MYLPGPRCLLAQVWSLKQLCLLRCSLGRLQPCPSSVRFLFGSGIGLLLGIPSGTMALSGTSLAIEAALPALSLTGRLPPCPSGGGRVLFGTSIALLLHVPSRTTAPFGTSLAAEAALPPPVLTSTPPALPFQCPLPLRFWHMVVAGRTFRDHGAVRH